VEKKVISQNSAQGEKILKKERVLSPAELEVQKRKDELKAMEAQIKKDRVKIQAELKAQKEEAKKVREEERERKKAEREAKKANKIPTFTRAESVGIVMKAHPNAPAAEVIRMADELYVATTKRKSNESESKWAYLIGVKFLKGYLNHQ